MKKIIFCIVMIGILCFGRELNRNQIEVRGKIIYEKGKYEPYTGAIKEYHENGKIRKEENYKNGKLEGIYRRYYESGQLEYECNHKNNRLVGVSKQYYENGKLMAEQNYVFGKEESSKKEYYKNGALKEESVWKFKEKGSTVERRHGLTKIYDENGRIFLEVKFKNGEVSGKVKDYTE
ncbi:MAG: toxin-antitoxin system YwqK family antitoxin [Fusobacteriaceae bacterium]|nr:toxin-antitoxin system YwqK family antitoxin [Fusobacteriaceae bacterium]